MALQQQHVEGLVLNHMLPINLQKLSLPIAIDWLKNQLACLWQGARWGRVGRDDVIYFSLVELVQGHPIEWFPIDQRNYRTSLLSGLTLFRTSPLSQGWPGESQTESNPQQGQAKC